MGCILFIEMNAKNVNTSNLFLLGVRTTSLFFTNRAADKIYIIMTLRNNDNFSLQLSVFAPENVSLVTRFISN